MQPPRDARLKTAGTHLNATSSSRMAPSSCRSKWQEFEITPWILTWGDTAEVLEPVELRERLTTIAIGLAKRYAPENY